VKSKKAILITEMEPTEYELFTISFAENTIKDTHYEDVKVEVYLENTSTQQKLVSLDEDFEVQHQQYWGSVKGN